MRVFDCNQDESEELLDFEIDARHRWTLPGLKCEVCGDTWATTGVEYPTVDISAEPYAKEYEKGWPVSLPEFKERRARIRSYFREDALLPPGAEFGSLEGKATGRFPDFVWFVPWTLLLKRAAYEQLRSYGVALPQAVAPQLRFSKNSPADLVELEIEPIALLADESFLLNGEPCAGCGREARRVNLPVVSTSSLPQHVDLFRPRNFPTYILGNERFKEAVEALSLKGIVFSELKCD